MLFTITCLDKPGSLVLRRGKREAHLAYLDAQAAALVSAGAMLGADGDPLGSLLVVDVADAAAARALADGDPYGQAGLFESVTIHPYQQVFAAGARVAA